MVNASGLRIGYLASLVCLGAPLGLAACQSACPLPGQIRATSLKLYFGRGSVSDEAWADFATRVLTPAFPDGFTAYEAFGQWRNPANGTITRERSFVVETVGPVSVPRVAAVASAYRKTFNQISVGEVSQDVCAAF